MILGIEEEVLFHVHHAKLRKTVQVAAARSSSNATWVFINLYIEIK